VLTQSRDAAPAGGVRPAGLCIPGDTDATVLFAVQHSLPTNVFDWELTPLAGPPKLAGGEAQAFQEPTGTLLSAGEVPPGSNEISVTWSGDPPFSTSTTIDVTSCADPNTPVDPHGPDDPVEISEPVAADDPQVDGETSTTAGTETTQEQGTALEEAAPIGAPAAGGVSGSPRPGCTSLRL
jgi:hypothetical protein